MYKDIVHNGAAGENLRFFRFLVPIFIEGNRFF